MFKGKTKGIITICVISYLLYGILFLGVILHTSDQPVFLGKYSSKYLLFLGLFTGILIPWHYFTKFLCSTSIISSPLKKYEFKPKHKILSVACQLFLAFLLAELYLRSEQSEPNKEYLKGFDPFLQNKLVPDVKFGINSYGFRGEEIHKVKPNNTKRIFLLGGSTVLSARVEFEKSHARILENSLRESISSMEIEVLNAGNHWHTSKHSIIKYLFKVRNFDPDLIIVWHGINDLVRSFASQQFSYGKYQEDYSHFYGALSGVFHGHVSHHKTKPIIEFESILMNRISKQRVLFKDLITGPIETKIEYIKCPNFPSLIPFEKNMRSLVHLAKSDGVEIILATQPNMFKQNLTQEEKDMLFFAKTFCTNQSNQAPDLNSMINGMNLFNSKIRQICKEENIGLIDLEKKVSKKAQFFCDDVHYTEDGNKLIALTLKDFILSNQGF
jgi:hypothetical protein